MSNQTDDALAHSQMDREKKKQDFNEQGNVDPDEEPEVFCDESGDGVKQRRGNYQAVTNTLNGNISWFSTRLLSVLATLLCIIVLVLSGYVFWQQEELSTLTNSVSDSTKSTETNGLNLSWKAFPESSEVLTTIAFGSCISQHMPQPHWDTIVNYDPDLLVLMGDNVYFDCRSNSCHMEEAYQDFIAHPSVQGAAPKLSVFATLDDHDYGGSDCHGDNPNKDVARQLFHQVFAANQELPTDGVYRSMAWGPPGQRVQIILLDTRYNRSPFVSTVEGGGSPYIPVNDTTIPQLMLGERQWSWLEEQLQEQADLRLIISSIQVLNDVTGYECWRHLPRERKRLYDLLSKQENPTSTIILSGDRHMGGYYQSEDGLVREVTSSSFTHSFPLEAIAPTCTPEECDEVDPRRIGPLEHENHWGSIEVDWQNKNMTVALRRSESSPGIAYLGEKKKKSDAGQILRSESYSFA